MPTRSDNLQVLTNSRLASFRACKRLHHYSYELKRRPTRTSDALRFGTLWHVGLEAWWKAAPMEYLHAARLDLALTAMRAHYDGTDVDGQDPYELAKALALMNGYHLRWALPIDTMKVLAVEAEFSSPLINPDTAHKSHTFALAGKIDAIVEIDGKAWLVEHKSTTGDITPGSTYWQRLRMDSQVSAYYEGAAQLGYEVVGCIYDVASRPMLKPLKATPVESRKFTKEGALYANQRLEDEDAGAYYHRCVEDIAANPDEYFQRAEVVRLETDIVEHQRDVWATARHLRDVQLSGVNPRNPDSCFRYNTQCSYWDVCTGCASIDDDTLFRSSASTHEELAK